MTKLPLRSLHIQYFTGDGFRSHIGGMMESTDLYILPRGMIQSIGETESTLCNPHRLHKIDLDKYDRVILDHLSVPKNPNTKVGEKIVNACLSKYIIILGGTAPPHFKLPVYVWDPYTQELIKEVEETND